MDRVQKDRLNTYLKVVNFVGLIALIVLVRNILLLAFIAILISALSSFPVDIFSKKISRGFAVVLTLFLLFGGVSALGILTVPQLSDQAQAISKQIPEAIGQIQRWFRKVKTSEPVSRLPKEMKNTDQLSKPAGGLFELALKGIFPAAKEIVGLVVAFVFVLVLSIFFIVQPDSYRNGMRNLIPREYEKAFDETYERLHQGLRYWVGGILIVMTLMGLFTGIGLAIAGIEDWFLLACLTFIGTFVPYLGAISSAVPGLLIALSQSPKHFFHACIVYLGVHILEGYIAEPLIMRRAVQLKPAVLLLGQSILLTLFGVLGVIVAAPLLACLQIMIQYLYVERKLGKHLTSKY